MRERLTRRVTVAPLLGLAIGALSLSTSSPASAPPPRRARSVASVAQRAAFDAPIAGRLPVGRRWVATWSASPQGSTPHTPSGDGFREQTVRNVVFTSVGGSMVRVRFTNAWGTRPLVIGRAAIGVRWSGAGLAGRSRELSFAGRPSKVIPPGGAAESDPVPLSVRALQELVVSVYLPVATGPATLHAIAEQVNYVASGDHVTDGDGDAFKTRDWSWYFVASVDALTGARILGTVVALGDSITDGFASGTNANGRWPNDLARRLDSRPGPSLSVVDEGIGGNRLLNGTPCCGPSAVARFERDVVRRAGVRDVILLEGINDIGSNFRQGASTGPAANVSAGQIIAGYRKIIALAHAARLKIFGGTLTPFQGAAYWSPAGEAEREAVNRWILASHAFDGVIDFARAVADPSDPTMFRSSYDSGDHLHPNRAGYRAMADAISLSMLLRPTSGRRTFAPPRSAHGPDNITARR